MISFGKAQQKAKEYLPKITSYTERNDAYIFVDGTRKWDGEVDILKENGKKLSYAEYVVSKNDDET